MQERTLTSEIEIGGKDVLGLFECRRRMGNVGPISEQPGDMGGLEVTPERVAQDTCLDPVMASHHAQEASNQDTSSEQAKGRTAEALDDEHCAQSQQDYPGAAFRIEAAHGLQTQETLFEAHQLAPQGMDFALLHTYHLCSRRLPLMSSETVGGAA